RAFPSTKGLSPHNGTGNTPVDIQIPSGDTLRPVADLLRVQRMDTRGQAVGHGIDVINGLDQGFGRHDAKYRTEVFGQMILRSEERRVGKESKSRRARSE